MRQRRARYTVELADGAKKVILAHDACSADLYYRARGFQVERVVKGDYRVHESVAGGFKINQANLNQAIELLGITWPVELKMSGRVGSKRGEYALIPTGGSSYLKGGRIYNIDLATSLRHRITIKSYLSPEQAGQTLWHELTHAMQAERDTARITVPSAKWRAWKRQGRNIGYENKPHEIEARGYHAFNDDLPLAR